MLRKVLIGLALFFSAVYFWNASWLAAPTDKSELRLIAHRGVNQTYPREGLERDTCTAKRIFVPAHSFLENTIASMQAAFEAGADVVEFDVVPTTDDTFAIFHDWTLDCRTEGSGPSRGRSMAYLKTLDIGYGYTADEGQTYPFRGKGIGMMPSIANVMNELPEGRFLVNFKSRKKREGDMFAAMLQQNPDWRKAVWAVYGGDAPTNRAMSLIGNLKGYSRKSLMDCLIKYELLGWMGYVPESCRNTVVSIPLNVAPFIWGWPNRFLKRMRSVDSKVVLLGPYTSGDPGSAGIDNLSQLELIPENFDGYVWTNRIEIIGPALKSTR